MNAVPPAGIHTYRSRDDQGLRLEDISCGRQMLLRCFPGPSRKRSASLRNCDSMWSVYLEGSRNRIRGTMGSQVEAKVVATISDRVRSKRISGWTAAAEETEKHQEKPRKRMRSTGVEDGRWWQEIGGRREGRKATPRVGVWLRGRLIHQTKVVLQTSPQSNAKLSGGRSLR